MDILLTTESASNLAIDKRLEIISAECVLGINALKDYFTSVTDFIGGRSKTTQNSLREATKTVLAELKKEAKKVGANAVVGVDIDYSEFSGNGKSMILVVATGTAVIAR
jgi:uncharacterized protein YbjQ (UPF0145 family)